MRVEELSLPPEAESLFGERGIEELYPPQAEAVDSGLLEGESLTLSVPTASGKTMVAEMAMLQSLLAGGRALYVVPLRALASEKYETFSEYEDFGIDVGIATGDFDESGEWLGRNDLVIATSEKVDSLLRNGASWLNELEVVVLDEVHLVNDGERGPTLEMVVAHLEERNPGAQFLALSATVSNADEVAEWLDSGLVTSDWRPVELREGVLYGSAVHYPDGKEEVEMGHRDEATALALEAVEDGGQCIIFASSRRNAEAAAKRAASVLDEEGLEGAAAEVEDVDSTDTSEDLAGYVESGAAFHHAGLTWRHREVVEREFRERNLKVVAATPTLAMGVNMPARRVVIKNHKRYDGTGMAPLPVMEVHQMFGRAGRPGLDDVGEALLIAKNHDELEELQEHYVEAEPERVFSKLASEAALRKHLLALLSGGSRSKDEILVFLEGTLHAVQSSGPGMEKKVDSALDFLVEEGFLVRGDGYAATRLGQRVAQLYVDPVGASTILKGMERSDRATPIGLLHLVSATPDMRSLYLTKGEEERMNRFFTERYDDLMMEPGFTSAADDLGSLGFEEFLPDLKTARMLEWWTDERGEDAITEEFGVGPGDIRYRVETAEWLLNAAAELSRVAGLGFEEEISRLETRVKHGVGEELLELVSLDGVGRVRARALWNEGFKTAAEVLNGDAEELVEVPGMGPKTVQRVTGSDEVPEVSGSGAEESKERGDEGGGGGEEPDGGSEEGSDGGNRRLGEFV